MAFGDTGVLDNFNRANNASLGANWGALAVGAAVPANYAIASNRADANAFGSANHWSASALGPDCEVFMSMPTMDAVSYFVYLRIVNPTSTTTQSGYRVEFNNNSGVWTVWRIDNNVYTAVGTTISSAFFSGSLRRMGAAIEGNTITLYKDDGVGTWSSIGTRTDSTYTAAGFVGMSVTGGPTIEDFGGGTVGGGESHSGAGTDTVKLATSSQGAKTGQALGAASVRLADQGTGHKATQTAGAATIRFTTAAAGSASEQHAGSGAATVRFTTTATGRKGAAGAGVTSVDLADAATGRKDAVGHHVEGVPPFEQLIEGVIEHVGLSTIATGSAVESHAGAGQATVRFTTAATGRKSAAAAASCTSRFSSSCTGAKTGRGPGACGVRFTTQAVGTGSQAEAGPGGATVRFSTSATGRKAAASACGVQTRLDPGGSGRKRTECPGTATVRLLTTASGHPGAVAPAIGRLEPTTHISRRLEAGR